MPKKLRDFLFFLFIFLFIIITLGTSLYASGYKLNLKKPLQINRLLLKTGTLSLVSSPKDAYIYLDNKKISNNSFNFFKREDISTPAKIKNLLPGKYTLRLEKDNYWPLEKEVYIESGLNTSLDNINLFRSDLPTLVYNSEKTNLLLNSNAQYLYLVNSKEFIDLKLGNVKNIDNKKISDGLWLKEAPYFFSKGIIYNISDASSNELLANSDKLSWKYDKDNNTFYYTDKAGSIYKLDKNITLLLANANSLDYKQDYESLFIITQVASKKYLEEIEIETKNILQKIELANSADYRFANNANNSHLILYDKQNSSLYLIDKSNWHQSFQINDIKDWAHVNRDTIIYHNGWEIVLLNLKDKSYRILSRFSEPILDIIWHSQDNYYIFSTNDSLIAGDINTNALTTLFKTQGISGIALDDANDILYFHAQLGRQPGIYKLQLK